MILEETLTSQHVLLAAIVLAAIAAMLFLTGMVAHLVRRRRCRHFCPGPRPHPMDRLHPLHWFRSGRCGYDLSAHLRIAAIRAGPPSPDGSLALTCPECGSAFSSARRLFTRPWHWRFLAPGALAFTAAVGLLALHPGAIGRAVRAVPTPVLMAGDRWVGVRWPARMQRELRRRQREGDLSPAQCRAMIPLLVRDLRDDDIRFNAIGARRPLTRFGDEAVPHLLEALESDDAQQRREAASILRGLNHPPSTALLRVSFESLRHDGVPRSAASSASYLLRHLDLAETNVRRGLESDDAQQRLLCAGLLALGGRTQYAEAVMPILIAHLADNSSTVDATFAVQAIGGLGQAALPHLLPHLDAADDQQRQIVRFLAVKLDPEAHFTAHIVHPPQDLRFMCRSIDPTRRSPLSSLNVPYLAAGPPAGSP